MIRRHVLTIALGMLLACTAVGLASAAGVIEEVEPDEISQGDTVLLTIRGSQLPEGSLVVEFYPQQIAVLDILAASDTEIVAQCKVPSLAQPGDYNLLVYNQLGIEVFKEAALTVRSELFTPVFTAYSPKAFVEADAGFAIMLTGDLISEEALKLLSVSWSREGKELPTLETSLAMAGPGTVVAAVSGNPGSGILRGTVLMGDTPIYLLEVEIYPQGTDILGMSPAEVNGNAEWITIKLVGQGLTNLSSDSLALFLSRGKRKYAASTVSVLNDSAAESSFPGPLDAGEYELTAERDGQLLYTGSLTVNWEETPETDGEDQESAGDAGLSQQPFETGDQEASEQGEVTGTAPGENGQPLPDAGGAEKELIQGISVTEIPAGTDPVRIDLLGPGLTPAKFERLSFSLEVAGSPADLVLSTSLGGQYSLIFAPKLGAWQPGTSASLRITDPLGAYSSYETTLPVSSGMHDTGSVEPTPGPQSWEVSSISVNSTGGQAELEVSYAGHAAGLDPAGFSGNFSLIPRASGMEGYFSNLTTNGEFSYEITPEGRLIARARGNFVSGSLLARTRYESGPQELSIAELETGSPGALLSSPADLTLTLNTNTGEISPKMLGWSVEFAPLEPSDPSLVQLSVSRADGTPAAVAAYIEGTQIHFSLTTAGLVDGGAPRGSIECRFVSDIGLVWNREPVDYLTVVESSSPYASIQVEFAETEVALEGDGFDLSLLPSGELPEELQWSTVKLRSGNERLNELIDGFMVREVPTELFGRPGVTLEFRRNSSMVSDEQFRELVASLTGQRQVLITLSWEELGIEQTGWITFSRAD